MPRRYQIAAYTLLFTACLAIGFTYNIDFAIFYKAAVASFMNPESAYFSNGIVTGFFYSPVMLTLIKPLGYVTYNVAKVFWTLLQVVSLLVLLKWAHRKFSFLNQSTLLWLWFFIVLINPVHNNFQSNNIQLMLLALLIAGEELSHQSSRKKFLAGTLVSLAALIKVYPAFIAVLYLLIKPKAVKAGVIFGGLLLLTLPFIVFGTNGGISGFESFYLSLTRYFETTPFTIGHSYQSLPSMITRFFYGTLSNEATRLITTLANISVVILFYGVVWKQQKKDTLAVWSAALAVMVLINPSSLVHYLVFYIPGMCLLLQTIFDKHFKNHKQIWGLSLATLLFAFTMQGVVGRDWAIYFEFKNLPAMGLVLLVILILQALNASGENRTLT